MNEPATEFVVDVSRCIECGYPLRAHARFCGNCRHPVGNRTAEAASPFAVDQGQLQTPHPDPLPVAPREFPRSQARTSTAKLAGLANHQRTVVWTVLLVWLLNVPFAVFYGVLGLIFGGIGGAVGGFSLLDRLPLIGSYVDVFSYDVGGVPGALIGAVVGLLAGVLAGLFAPLLLAGGRDPIDMLVVALAEIFIAIIIALLYTAYAMRFERRRLELTGARRPSRREAELVDPIVDACVTRLGLAHRPVLLIRDDSDPGAMGHTRHIVVSTGLLQEFDFDPEPIGAVLGHELVHVANGDAVAHVFVKGLAWPLYLSYSVLSAIPRLVGHTFMKVLVWLFFWPIMFSVQGVLMPIQSADFRRSEYRADMGAILAGHRRGIRMLLGRMKAIDASPSGWDAAICRTSPPSELRLERLEEPDTPYGLPDRSLRDDSLPDHSRLDHSHPRPAAIGAVGVPLAQD